MMKLGKIVTCMLVLVLLLSLPACSKQADEKSHETSSGNVDVKIGIVLTTSGKGDKSFNDSAIAGLSLAEDEFGISYKEIQPKDVADIEKSIEFLAKENYDIVFTVGFNSAAALGNVAPNYPDTNFVIIDHDFKDAYTPNLKSLLFKEEEGSFLAGVLAAEQSASGVLGFVGGMESPLIKKFEAGFTAGVKAVRPEAEILVSYVSADATGFNNPSRAKEITLNMITKNADVIYHAAGGSGQGMLDAASEKGIIALGVDSNQNWVKPGTVIASMLKRVDHAVFEVIDKYIKGELEMGSAQVFDLSDGGVALTDLTELTSEETSGVSEDDQNKIRELKATITDDTKALIDEYKQQIIEGKLTVPYE